MGEELGARGYVLCHDPDALDASLDEVSFCERLFGQRPIRFQRMLIEPDLAGNQRSLPKTKVAGDLHNDCAHPGMPPHVQVMICERQARTGGASFVLDLWPVLERIEREDPSLFGGLFRVPRAMPSGHMTRYGTTWSYSRGDLVCLHPSRVRTGRVGKGFQHFVDAAAPVAFRCAPGDFYVNNNHRCLHGREAFDDPSRRFVRLLYWFGKPMKAPLRFLESARDGSNSLAQQLSDRPSWVRQVFGADATGLHPNATSRYSALLETFARPTNCDAWAGQGQQLLIWQEALLSQLWQLCCQHAGQDFDLAALAGILDKG
ncbi:TauD/TfdA family dioxygenase [Ramlibacter sp. AW1]|uniref:TauD/TfdA family dioxygenase n=1 Tax=Ramlibacter aurantiacus TaxID=2801330 RepID=A0A937D518_9BURK|nr:TauD/TfdA family dioxygenase [Ramlibacter aurantiacus]MBL0419453.1 TauD/TfdA family dioxygenase [Ramlibacter aurantiacus]